MRKMFFNILATFAEFEVDLLRMRTREGMAVARAEGKLRGKRPKLSPKQQAELRRMHDSGNYTITDLSRLATGGGPSPHRGLLAGGNGAKMALAISIAICRAGFESLPDLD